MLLMYYYYYIYFILFYCKHMYMHNLCKLCVFYLIIPHLCMYIYM